MKGCISPQTPANKLPSPASVLIPRAAVVADVVGGSWDDRRLRDDTFEQQDFCSWHRCLGVRREGLPCLGRPLSVASALRFILPSGDHLSMYMCKKPHLTLTSLL